MKSRYYNITNSHILVLNSKPRLNPSSSFANVCQVSPSVARPICYPPQPFGTKSSTTRQRWWRARNKINLRRSCRILAFLLSHKSIDRPKWICVAWWISLPWAAWAAIKQWMTTSSSGLVLQAGIHGTYGPSTVQDRWEKLCQDSDSDWPGVKCKASCYHQHATATT